MGDKIKVTLIVEGLSENDKPVVLSDSMICHKGSGYTPAYLVVRLAGQLADRASAHIIKHAEKIS